MSSSLRLVVDHAVANLRAMLEGPYQGFFDSVVLPLDIDPESVSDLVEVIPATASMPFDLTQQLENPARLSDWLASAADDVPTAIDTRAAGKPLHRAVHLFARGIPCISWDAIESSTLDLIEFRSSHPAFSGTFSFAELAEGNLRFSWDLGIEFARLDVDWKARSGAITHSSPDGRETFQIPNE